MNRQTYEDLVKELNSLEGEDKEAVNIQKKLKSALKVEEQTKLRRDDVTAILVAFYEYMSKDPIFEGLTNFCRNTFSNYFKIPNLERSFNDIINDDFLLDKIVSICDTAVIQKLVDISYDKGIGYSKLIEKCEKFNRNIIKPISDSAQNVIDKINVMNAADPVVYLSKSDLNFSSKPLSVEERNERYSDINKIRAQHNEEKKEALNNKVEELNNAGVNVSTDTLEKILDKKNIDITKYDVEVSEKFTLRNSSKSGLKLTNLMFKYVDTPIVSVMGDDKKKFVISPSKASMRIAACNKITLNIIKKAKAEKQKIADRILSASSNVKNTIIKMTQETKNIVMQAKNNVGYKMNEGREKLANSLYSTAERINPGENYFTQKTERLIDRIEASEEERKRLLNILSEGKTIGRNSSYTENSVDASSITYEKANQKTA